MLFFTLGWDPMNYILALRRAEVAVMQYMHYEG